MLNFGQVASPSSFLRVKGGTSTQIFVGQFRNSFSVIGSPWLGLLWGSINMGTVNPLHPVERVVVWERHQSGNKGTTLSWKLWYLSFALVCCLPVGRVLFSPLTCFLGSSTWVPCGPWCALHRQPSWGGLIPIKAPTLLKWCLDFVLLWIYAHLQHCWSSEVPEYHKIVPDGSVCIWNILISYFFKKKHWKPWSAKQIQNNGSIQRSQQIIFSKLFAILVLLNMPSLLCVLVFIQNVAKELNHRMEMLEVSWSLLFLLFCV